MTTALIIIDVQQVLCAGEYAAFEAGPVIERINTLSRRARAAGLPVVVIQHETQGADMDYGTEGWRLAPALEVHESDIRVRKATCDSFHRTDLQAALEKRGVTDLVVCGMQTDFCVDTTVRRALALGFPVVLVADGHTTLDNRVLGAREIIAHHNATLSNIDSFGVKVRAVPAAEVVLQG